MKSSILTLFFSQQTDQIPGQNISNLCISCVVGVAMNFPHSRLKIHGDKTICGKIQKIKKEKLRKLWFSSVNYSQKGVSIVERTTKNVFNEDNCLGEWKLLCNLKMMVKPFEEDPRDQTIASKEEVGQLPKATMKRKLKFTVGFVTKGEFSFTRKNALSPSEEEKFSRWPER